MRDALSILERCIQDCEKQINEEKVKELEINNVEAKLKEDIQNVCKELLMYKRISDIEIRKEEFEKTTTNKIKR